MAANPMPLGNNQSFARREGVASKTAQQDNTRIDVLAARWSDWGIHRSPWTNPLLLAGSNGQINAASARAAPSRYHAAKPATTVLLCENVFHRQRQTPAKMIPKNIIDS